MEKIDIKSLTKAALEKELAAPRLPVVALTASAFGEDRARCLAAGMAGLVVPKVKTLDQVRAMVAAAKCAPMQILFTAAKWGGMPPVPQGPLKSATNAAIRSPEVATHNTPHQTARTEPAARQCA